MRARGHRESGRRFHVCQRCADGARARGDARHSGRPNTDMEAATSSRGSRESPYSR